MAKKKTSEKELEFTPPNKEEVLELLREGQRLGDIVRREMAPLFDLSKMSHVRFQ